jgi:hypothetical protein
VVRRQRGRLQPVCSEDKGVRPIACATGDAFFVVPRTLRACTASVIPDEQGQATWRTVMKTNTALGIVLATVCIAIGAASAAPPSGTTQLDLRLRHEHVRQDNDLRDADALTLRARLGYSVPATPALTAFIELESVAALIGDYAPQQPGYAVVADPAESEVNQYGLRYVGAADDIPGLEATFGRSRLVLDNARWVGNVGWRQNEQTFDGAFLRYGSGPFSARYAWLHNVNTVTAGNVDLDAHVVHLTWDVTAPLTLTAYAYLLDYAAVGAADLDSFGLRASTTQSLGRALQLRSVAEAAHQRARTPDADFEADYLAVELALSAAGATLTLGHEQLGSDGGDFAVQTPLATKHAFQGWADVFLQTPPTGVRDSHVSLSGALGPLKVLVALHDYRADAGSTRYGREWNLSAGTKLHPRLGTLLKYARYAADGFGVDTEKLWLQFEYAL